MNLKISFLGTKAQAGKDHSCILVEHENNRIVVEPTQNVSNATLAIICDIDLDEFSAWKYYADNNVPIYTSSGVKQYLPDEKLKQIVKIIPRNWRINKLKILPEKVPVEPHHPMIGVRFPQYKVALIPELPSYLSQQLIKDISLPAHHIIVGLGSFEKTNHKVSFKDFVDRLEACKAHKGLLSITLTNFRKDLERHKNEVLKVLKERWNIPLFWATKGMVLEFDKNGNARLVKQASIDDTYIIEKLHLEQFKQEGIDDDLKNPTKRWRELIADLRYLAVGYDRLKRGKKWGDWTLDWILKYFGTIIDTLREKVKFVIPEKKDNTNWWRLYWEAKKNGYIKTAPPTEREEIRRWNAERKRLIKAKSLNKWFILRWIIEKALQAIWYSKSKPAYRLDIDLIKSDLAQLGWDKKELLIDSKMDGLRVTLLKIKGRALVLVDPEDLKRKSPNVSHRLPAIIREIEDKFPDGIALDGELIAMTDHEALHRTIINSVLNSKTNAEKLTPYAYVYVFDMMYDNYEDIRNLPLIERLNHLQRLPTTDHIIIERPSRKLIPGYSAYIVKGNRLNDIKQAWDFLTKDKGLKYKGKFVKYATEGVMIKLVDGEYVMGQNKNWAKVKIFKEIDGVILDKKLVKGAKRTWNYLLGLDIPEDYAKALASMHTKQWYNSAGVLIGKKLFRGKEVLGKNHGRWVMVMTKTDNTNVQGDIGDILRIAAEEVLKYENPEYPQYPRYSFYIGRVLELVPEKNVSDSLVVMERLSMLEPKRMSIEQLLRLKRTTIPKELRLVMEHIAQSDDIELYELYKWSHESHN